MPCPSEEAYYGDAGTNYTYARREYKPLAWIPELLSLKIRAESATPGVAHSNLSLSRPFQSGPPMRLAWTTRLPVALSFSRLR
jgi:hypothetical protein